jgi:glucosamine-6-phosphate deaminase
MAHVSEYEVSGVPGSELPQPQPPQAISPQALRSWLSVPLDELASRSRIPLTILPTPADVHRRFADDLFSELRDARVAGSELKLIVPVGPTGQYPLLAELVNDADLALDHVTFFGMDEWLDWQCRPLPLGHRFSLQGTFRRLFIDRLKPALRPDEARLIFPSSFSFEHQAPPLGQPGAIATTYGGFGYQGHLAFNEPPASRWTPITLAEFRASRTRIVPIAVDTLIAHSHRSLGGNAWGVPPMAVTLGMSELLAARRLRLYTDSGAWKQTILRILLFAEPTVDYPATLAGEHPDVHVVADEASAASPPADW